MSMEHPLLHLTNNTWPYQSKMTVKHFNKTLDFFQVHLLEKKLY